MFIRINNTRLIIPFLSAIFLSACVTPRISTVWKESPPVTTSYNKIMVAGIFEEKNDSLRKALEMQAVNDLSTLGYFTVSSLQEFGPYGLKSLSEEATYLTMCDNGIDAVITFALVDDSIGQDISKGIHEKYTSLFYYKRIWNYRQLQQQAAGRSKTDSPNQRWEMILFDLATLRPQCVTQTNSFNQRNKRMTIPEVIQSFVQNMMKEKIIKHQQLVAASPKPF